MRLVFACSTGAADTGAAVPAGAESRATLAVLETDGSLAADVGIVGPPVMPRMRQFVAHV